MKLRTAIALAISLALALALTATVVVVSVVLDRAARRELGRELERGRTVFEDLLRYRKSLHLAESRVLADEPRLKAVVATDDVTATTVLGVVADLRRALRCDLLLLTDRSGKLLADATHPEEAGDALGDTPVIESALALGEAEGIWIDGSAVFQVHGRRLTYGSTTVGAVVVGYRIDDPLATAVGRQIGAGVVVALDHKVIARSHFEGEVNIEGATIASALGGRTPEQTPREVQLDGVRYLMIEAALPDYHGEQSLRYAIFRSLDTALAPARSLLRILFGVTAAALLLALAAALWLARRLSRPVDELVAFAQRIAAGDLDPASIDGLREIRTLGTAMNQMVVEIALARTQIAEKTRLEKELEIAERIQMSILPRKFVVPGLAISAQMVPASEVGGDYYDVLPLSDGCWLGVGDVAGHGLPAGLVMLMVQSAFSALVRSHPDAAPHQIVVWLNQLLFDNVRLRLLSDEHVTFTAARYFTDGRVVFSGAHEAIIVLRAATGKCELVDTPGTWLGIIPNIAHATTDSTLQLLVGDVVVFYSDGVTEAVNEQREQLGIVRFCNEITKNAGRSAAELQSHLMHFVRRWSPTPDDDITLLVLRYEGEHGP